MRSLRACIRRGFARACMGSDRTRSRLRLITGIALLVPMLTAMAATVRPPATLDLDGSWQFRQLESSGQLASDPRAREWRTASVPGTVHTDLLANRAIPDPYVGAAEAGLQWIGLADWEYRREFQVDAATAASKRSDLVFEGLDTLAEVWLNDEKILDANNAFRTWRVPVQGRLKPGGNRLRVVLHSPITKLLPQVQAMPHKIAGNYPSPFGDEPKDAMTGNFVRKPGYHYGWDWGPRYVTAGIWKPVRLESWSVLRIDNLQLRQDKVDAGRADLTVRIALDVEVAGRYVLRLWQTAPDGKRTQVAEHAIRCAARATHAGNAAAHRQPAALVSGRLRRAAAVSLRCGHRRRRQGPGQQQPAHRPAQRGTAAREGRQGTELRLRRQRHPGLRQGRELDSRSTCSSRA